MLRQEAHAASLWLGPHPGHLQVKDTRAVESEGWSRRTTVRPRDIDSAG